MTTDKFSSATFVLFTQLILSIVSYIQEDVAAYPLGQDAGILAKNASILSILPRMSTIEYWGSHANINLRNQRDKVPPRDLVQLGSSTVAPVSNQGTYIQTQSSQFASEESSKLPSDSYRLSSKIQVPNTTISRSRINQRDRSLTNSNADKLIEGSGLPPMKNHGQKYDDIENEDDDDDDDDEDYEDYKDTLDSGSGYINVSKKPNTTLTNNVPSKKPTEQEIYNPFRPPPSQSRVQFVSKTEQSKAHETANLSTTSMNRASQIMPAIATVTVGPSRTPTLPTTKAPISPPPSKVSMKNNDTKYDYEYDYEEDGDDEDSEETSAFEDNDLTINSNAHVNDKTSSVNSNNSLSQHLESTTRLPPSVANQHSASTNGLGRSENSTESVINRVDIQPMFNLLPNKTSVSPHSNSSHVVSSTTSNTHDEADRDNIDEEEDEEEEEEEDEDDSLDKDDADNDEDGDDFRDAPLQVPITGSGNQKLNGSNPTTQDRPKHFGAGATLMGNSDYKMTNNHDDISMHKVELHNAHISTTPYATEFYSTTPVPIFKKPSVVTTSPKIVTPPLIAINPSTPTAQSPTRQTPSYPFSITTPITGHVPLYPPSKTIEGFTPQLEYSTTPKVQFMPGTVTNLLPYEQEFGMNDDSLTRQIFDKTVEVYKETERTLKRIWESVWPPNMNFDNYEPLLAQPIFFMFALAGAVMALVLLMMLVVYIVTYQIQPRDNDDISLY